MAIIRILSFPDPKLRRKGLAVTDFGEKTQQIIDNMFETHYNSKNCAALAATQLDIPDAPHITVIDFSEKKDQLITSKVTQYFEMHDLQCITQFLPSKYSYTIVDESEEADICFCGIQHRDNDLLRDNEINIFLY